MRRRGHSMLEILVATVIGAIVIVGAVLIFTGGIRLSLGLQASSHALQNGSSSIDRMRQGLEEATAVQLPDDAAPQTPWPSALLGAQSHYQVQQGSTTLNTGLYISLTSPQSLAFRTSATQLSTVAIANRRTVTRGALLYRGDSQGNPAPSNGTFLWQWAYENGAVTAKTVLYRKLASTWDAVAFRRGSQSGQVLRYRLLLIDKDSYQQDRSAVGANHESALETSDYAISLLNYAGESVPVAALPTAAGGHP
jgi:type II secretory pathway pseudopilin PulG